MKRAGLATILFVVSIFGAQVVHAYSQEEVNMFDEEASTSGGLKNDRVPPGSAHKTANNKAAADKQKGDSNTGDAGSSERRKEP